MQSASSSVTGQERKSAGSSEQYILSSAHTSQGQKDTSYTERTLSHLPLLPLVPLVEQDISDSEFSGDESSIVEGAEVSSDNIERQNDFPWNSALFYGLGPYQCLRVTCWRRTS